MLNILFSVNSLKIQKLPFLKEIIQVERDKLFEASYLLLTNKSRFTSYNYLLYVYNSLFYVTVFIANLTMPWNIM